MGLLPEIRKENERIADAIEVYIESEDKALEWFKTSMSGYMYYLAYQYDDDSGDTLLMSTDWEKICDCMEDFSRENEDVEYFVERYPYTDDEGIRNVDLQDLRGQVKLRNDMTVKEFCGIDKYQYDYMDLVPLLEPYVVLPYPFKKKDFIKTECCEETVYGLVYALCDDQSPKSIHRDKSDVVINIQLPYKEDGKIYFDHMHANPYDLEYADISEDSEEYRLLSRAKEEWEKNGSPVWDEIDD